MKIIKRFLLKIFRFLYRENIKYQIEIQRKQCCTGEHAVFYESTAISDSHGNKENIQIGDYSHIKRRTNYIWIMWKITIGQPDWVKLNEKEVVIVGNHTHFAPHTTICGRTQIGDNVFCGAGSTIIDKLIICDNVVIGAGTVVKEDITVPGTYAGIPARKIS